jgi:hypothetical protein
MNEPAQRSDWFWFAAALAAIMVIAYVATGISKAQPALAPATNEISVRACEVQAKAIGENMGRDFARQGVDPATLKAAARNICLLVEQEMYEKVRYTIPVVPDETRTACALIMAREQPPSYETMSKCLDKALAALATLPSGSATLQRAGKPDRHFWTATECSIHRSASGGVCIEHSSSGASITAAPSASSYSRGLAALDRGDFDAAIVEFTAAMRDDPADSFAYLKRATAYEKKGDSAAAISDYRKALKLVDGESRGEINATIRRLGGKP